MPIAAILRAGPVLVLLDPDAGAALDPDGVDAVVGQDGDDHGLQPLHVIADAGLVPEFDDGVADQLPGPVPGELAAAVHGHHRGAVKRAFVVLGAFARGVDGGVFKQQDRAGCGPGEDPLVEFALDVPAAGIFDEFRGETQPGELKSHGIQLRPRPPRAPILCRISHSCG